MTGVFVHATFRFVRMAGYACRHDQHQQTATPERRRNFVVMRALVLGVLLIACLGLFWLQGDRDPVSDAAKSVDVTPKLSRPDPSAIPTPRPVATLADADESSELANEASGPESLAAMAAAIMHSANPGQPCLAGTSRNDAVKSATIHRWTDEAGIIHFSDQAPAAGVAGHRRIEVEGVPPVRVAARGIDVNLPDFAVQRASMDAQAIERVMRTSLGVTGAPGLELTIEFIASRDTYAKHIGDAALADSDGSYSSRDRTIRVRQKDDTELNFRILRHEMTHALVHEHIGFLPTSINEGLAGFFEHIEVAGMGARVTLPRGRQDSGPGISADGHEELIDLLAREGGNFYGEGQETRYWRALALIAVLMERVEGRNALAKVLAAQRLGPCRPVEAARILDLNYPGGLVGLAEDWVEWLRDPPQSVHSW